MKLSTSLLQAITLGMSITAVTASAASCEKQKIKAKQEGIRNGGSNPGPTCPTEPCAACGMG